MENNQNALRINPIITIVVILQLIFIIFAGITIRNLLSYSMGAPEIKINNYSAIPDGEILSNNNILSNNQGLDFALNDADKHTIESTIYDAVLLNDKGSIANRGAKIREGSARHVYIKNLSAFFLDFIVDIEDIGQSYHFAWLGGGDSSGQNLPEVVFLMAFCPKEDELIYGDFSCKDEYNGHGLDIVAYNLIRRYPFNSFSTELSDVYAGYPLKITIQLYPGEDSTEEIAVQELSTYLSDLGINLNDFEYDFFQLLFEPLPSSETR